MLTVSVIIPCHNNSHNLELIFLALNRQSSPAEEIICVDDSSTSSELKLMKQLCYKYGAKLVRLPENRINFGRRSQSRNYGTWLAAGDVCLYLDGDMVIGPDYLRRIRLLHSLDPNIMVKGARYTLNEHDQAKGISYCWEIVTQSQKRSVVVKDIYRTSTTQLAKVTSSTTQLLPLLPMLAKKAMSRRVFIGIGTYLVLQAFLGSFPSLNPGISYSNRWDYCASNNLSVRKKHVQRVGYWDEDFVGWGEEDMDFAYRLFKDGISPVLPDNGTIYAYHLDHEVDNAMNAYTLEKNANHFLKKFPIMRLIRKDVYDNYNIKV
jgi:glycosyltransferase involved in cell wall biosynthesis